MTPKIIPATCASHATRVSGAVKNCETKKKASTAQAGRYTNCSPAA